MVGHGDIESSPLAAIVFTEMAGVNPAARPDPAGHQFVGAAADSGRGWLAGSGVPG